MARLTWQLYYAMASQGWGRVEGTVRNSEVKETDSDGPSYEPRIDYEYVVGKTLYRAHRMSYGLSSAGSRRRARRVVDEYPLGKTVIVWYDPSQPSRATLKTGGERGVAVALLVVSLFAPAILFVTTDAGQRFLSEHGISFLSDTIEP